MKNVLRIGVLAAVLAGCSQEPLGYEYTDQYNLSILQGGDGGVYFLPPLLLSSYSGTFAPDREPVVVVCAGAPASLCAAPVAILDMQLDAGEDWSEVVQVNASGEKYTVNWKAHGQPQGQYRIFVTEGGAAQAFIDVALTRGNGGFTTSANRAVRIYGSSSPREFSGTLAIAFRMEVRDVPEPMNGLRAEYFDWSSTALDFAAATPILERLDPVIDFVDPDGTGDMFGIGQTDYTMVRWSGFLVAPADGFYTFCVTADDGFRLFVNGFQFLNRWSDQAGETRCVSYSMLEGTSHPIRLEWYRAAAGPAAVRLLWQTTPDNQEVIPASALLPS
jgi:hypothetical protein